MAELFAMKTPSGQLDPLKIKYPIAVQPKLDGLRGLCATDGCGDSVWSSFSGKPLWNLEFLSLSMPKGVAAVFDGEIVWPGHPFSDANGLCKRRQADEETLAQSRELQFHVFDVLSLSEWEVKKTDRPYINRHQRMHSLSFGPSVIPMLSKIVWSPEELDQEYRVYLDAGHEGLMAKERMGLYHWKRHPDWHRYKPTETADVVVVAAYEEYDKNGKPKGTLGGFVVRTESGHLCKVGNGFKAHERKSWWWGDIGQLKTLPKFGLVYDNHPMVGQVIECEFKCWTQDGAMREPFFKRMRPDK
jgi:ATP-dependent DNA ligase